MREKERDLAAVGRWLMGTVEALACALVTRNTH